MRFFSNEAKESADDRDATDNENDGVRAESDGATVPQQRSGSPWSDGPGSADASTSTDVTDPETRDDNDEAEAGDQESLSDDSVQTDAVRADDESAPVDEGSARVDEGSARVDEESLQRDDSEERHDGDDLVRDADGPRGDDELDLPLDDHAGVHRADSEGNSIEPVDSEPVDSGAVDSDVVDSDPGAEQRAGTTTTYGPDGSLTTVEGSGESDAVASDTVDSETASSDVAASDPVDSDTADSDLAASNGAVSGPVGAGTTEDESDRDRDLDEAVPVDATAPVADEAGEAGEAGAPAVAAVPVGAADATTGAKPDPSASPVGDKLFTDGDSFTERLRDITLNFVDDPKDAAAQAGALVDEAIDKVTSALKAQKDALAGEGDDTERLRVELRGYRDILKRISSL